MGDKQATVTCTVIRIEPVGQRAVLIADLLIDCDICGQLRVQLAGHHLQPVVRLLQEVIAACPEETEQGEVVSQVDIDLTELAQLAAPKKGEVH